MNKELYLKTDLRPIPIAAWSKGGYADAVLLGLWAHISPGAWMSLSFECCVLTGRGVRFGLITCSILPSLFVCVCVCVCG